MTIEGDKKFNNKAVVQLQTCIIKVNLDCESFPLQGGEYFDRFLRLVTTYDFWQSVICASVFIVCTLPRLPSGGETRHRIAPCY